MQWLPLKKGREENRGAATPRRVETDCGQEWQLVGLLCCMLCNRQQQQQQQGQGKQNLRRRRSHALWGREGAVLSLWHESESVACVPSLPLLCAEQYHARQLLHTVAVCGTRKGKGKKGRGNSTGLLEPRVSYCCSSSFYSFVIHTNTHARTNTIGRRRRRRRRQERRRTTEPTDRPLVRLFDGPALFSPSLLAHLTKMKRLRVCMRPWAITTGGNPTNQSEIKKKKKKKKT